LCGHRFSASTISQINKGRDEALARFANRRLEEDDPDLILDARYEKVRQDGVIRSLAVLIAIGINWEGQRLVLAVELANCENRGCVLLYRPRLSGHGFATQAAFRAA